MESYILDIDSNLDIKKVLCVMVEIVKRGRGRPKLTWVESVKRDLRIGTSLKR